MNPTRKSVGIRGVTFGANVTVVEPVNIYECVIGDDTFIGPFVEIQKGARIGRRCRIQSHSFICELVTIGDETTVAHGVMFINDTYSTGGPARGDTTLWKETRVGSHVSIGSNATILPVTICDRAVIGAGAVVTKNIDVPGIYAGNPATLVRKL
jgi:acetyltransferase-like isoleucine patch superfamily enzyme